MTEAWATVESLAEDAKSGAAEIADRAAHVLPDIPADEVPDAIETLLRAHRQMAPLWRLASDVLGHERASEGAEVFRNRLAGDHRAADVLAPVLPDRVLTISYSSSVREAIRARTPAVVLCMESQPGGEGLQMAGAVLAWSQAEVVSDDEAIEQLPADAVVVGADAVTPGGMINKVKTRALAEAARSRDVPCFVLAGETKFVPLDLPTTDSFEATPIATFSGVATPMGLLTPSEAVAHAAGVEVHPVLHTLLDRL